MKTSAEKTYSLKRDVMQKCEEHSGIEARISGLEDNRPEIWRSIDKAHERIDGMKNWVIAGMTSLIIQLFVMLGGAIALYFKLRG